MADGLTNKPDTQVKEKNYTQFPAYHTVTLFNIHSGYSCSEQAVQAPNQEYWCFLATPKRP